MKSLMILGLVLFSLSAQARPLNCIVSFMQGSSLQDYVAPQVSNSQNGYNSYALINKNGFSFFATEAVDSDVLSLQIVDVANKKSHLGSAPVLRKGQRACVTVDLGRNSNNESVKVAISCEAM